jgi:hypothetical protein
MQQGSLGFQMQNFEDGSTNWELEKHNTRKIFIETSRLQGKACCCCVP